MAFCLTKNNSKKFLKAIADKKLDINKLSDPAMTSAARREIFADVLDISKATAQEINTLFESKLILKYQKKGMINFIEKTSGLKTNVKRDLISRVNRMEEILNPSDEKAFLEDIVAKKLNISVTREEAKKIYELSNKAEALRGIEGKEIEYGNAVLDFMDYTNSLDPKKLNLAGNILNLPRTAKSTLDLSAPLRQGFGMVSRPVHFAKAFGSMFKYALSDKHFRNLQADILSRPNYDLMRKSGLRVTALANKLTQREEAFMSNLLEKVPGVRASERAYVGFLNKLRADVFDDLVMKAEMAGENIYVGSQAGKDIAAVVNDFTGSGNIGKNDKYTGSVPWLNASFFSPRKMSATINMVNPERYINPKISPTARKAALRQLIGMIGVSTAILGLAATAGAKVEKDPNSADFGKIKVGKTRFDVTGGNATFAVLLSRLWTGKVKSSTTGKTYKLGTGYKPTERKDLLLDFTRNKFSPIASALATSLGWSFSEEDEELKNQLWNLFVPMIIDSALQQMDIDKDMLPYTILAEIFGSGVQAY